MATEIDAGQIERVLSHLAHLGHRRDVDDMETLDNLRPGWLKLDAWEIVLEDLTTQYYRERPRTAQLRLVR
jgi:hypothetical protein